MNTWIHRKFKISLPFKGKQSMQCTLDIHITVVLQELKRRSGRKCQDLLTHPTGVLMAMWAEILSCCPRSHKDSQICRPRSFNSILLPQGLPLIEHHYWPSDKTHDVMMGAGVLTSHRSGNDWHQKKIEGQEFLWINITDPGSAWCSVREPALPRG